MNALKGLILAGFVGACAVLAAGCGCAPAETGQPISFNASSETAVRKPAACSVADPPYAAGDVFTLTVVGATTGPAPYNTLTLGLKGASASMTQVPLTVPMSSAANPPATQTAVSPDASITFSFARGSDATEIDEGFLSSVLVTVVSMPTADGQSLSAALDITFTDGSELQDTYTAAVTTVCP